MIFKKEIKAKSGEIITLSLASTNDIAEMLSLQAKSTDPETFQAITREEMLESAEKDALIKASVGEKIIALAQIVVNRETERSLAPDADLPYRDVVTFDGVIVSHEYRGNGLQRIFLGIAEDIARERGALCVAATVAEANPYSRKNFGRQGFAELKVIPKYGSTRILVTKMLK